MSDKKVLVYEHRNKSSAPQKPKTMTQGELDHYLAGRPHLQATTKAINGKSRIDIYMRDLFTPDQEAAPASKADAANLTANVANIRIGWWKSRCYENLIILSDKKDDKNPGDAGLIL